MFKVNYTMFDMLDKTSQVFACKRDAEKFLKTIKRNEAVTKAELVSA